MTNAYNILCENISCSALYNMHCPLDSIPIKALHGTSSFKSFEISFNSITNEQMDNLIIVLHQNTKLSNLAMGYTTLQDTGIAAALIAIVGSDLQR